MKSRQGNTGLIILIVVGVVLLAVGGWFVWSSQRIISPVPSGSSLKERVLLITPKATPTSEFEPTPTLTEEEQKAKDEEEAAKAEEENETPTVTPKSSPTEKPTATNTPEPTNSE